VKFISPKDYTGTRAWEALPIASMAGITTRLHWADQPYKWHINDGEEVFVVLDGAVDMHYRLEGDEKVMRMKVGDICFASAGTEHVAHPVGEARVLVVESEGSV
jgi:mannose-6-phosphate isomerase-like protein (cupin superfamily)